MLLLPFPSKQAVRGFSLIKFIIKNAVSEEHLSYSSHIRWIKGMKSPFFSQKSSTPGHVSYSNDLNSQTQEYLVCSCHCAGQCCSSFMIMCIGAMQGKVCCFWHGQVRWQPRGGNSMNHSTNKSVKTVDERQVFNPLSREWVLVSSWRVKPAALSGRLLLV